MASFLTFVAFCFQYLWRFGANFCGKFIRGRQTMSLFSDFVPLFVFSFAYFKRDKITEQLHCPWNFVD